VWSFWQEHDGREREGTEEEGEKGKRRRGVYAGGSEKRWTALRDFCAARRRVWVEVGGGAKGWQGRTEEEGEGEKQSEK